MHSVLHKEKARNGLDNQITSLEPQLCKGVVKISNTGRNNYRERDSEMKSSFVPFYELLNDL